MYTSKTFAAVALAMATTLGAFSASAELPTYSVNPKAPVVESLDQVVLTFAEGSTVKELLYETTVSNGGDIDNRINYRTYTNAVDNTYVINLPEGVSNGNVVVNIPANSLSIDDVVYDEAITLQYLVSSVGFEGVVTPTPAAGLVRTLSTVVLTFEGGEFASYIATDTETAATLAYNGENVRVLTGDDVKSKGNTITFLLGDSATLDGEYTLTLPAGGYTVDGVPGEEDVVVNYSLADYKYSISPKAPVVESLESIVITFNDVTTIEELEYSAITLVNGKNEAQRYTTDINENVLTVKPIEVLAAGDYVLTIPANTLALDGNAFGKEISMQYKVSPALPEYTLTVDPADESTINDLSQIVLTFDGITAVANTIENTPDAPYVLDAAGECMSIISNVKAEGNVLTLTLGAAIETEGNVQVIIPGEGYTLDGVQGEEIVLNYTIKPVVYQINPKSDVLDAFEKMTLTFPNATTIEEVGYSVTIVNQDGEIFRPLTNLEGNVYTVAAIDAPLTKAGYYTVTVPAGTLKIDGNLFNKEVSQTYQVVAEAPEYTLVASPADGAKVAELSVFTLTFDGVEEVESLVEDSSNAPYVKENAEDSQFRSTVREIFAEGNVLTLKLIEPITENGSYTLVVPGTAYKYDGFDGEDIELTYTVAPVVFQINPKSDILDAFEKMTVTFPEATTVEEEAYAVTIVNEKGENFRPLTSVEGNVYTIAAIDAPIVKAGFYTVTIPAGTIKVDGEIFNQEISQTYQVVPETPEYTLTVDPAEGKVNNLQTIALTFDGVKAVELDGEVNSDNVPYIKDADGNRFLSFTNVEVAENVLTIALSAEYAEESEVSVVIPAGLVTLDGAMNEEIVLSYSVLGISGIDAIFGDNFNGNVTVYGINGQLIYNGDNKAAVNTLGRGLYIINGVKVIKK